MYCFVLKTNLNRILLHNFFTLFNNRHRLQTRVSRIDFTYIKHFRTTDTASQTVSKVVRYFNKATIVIIIVLTYTEVHTTDKAYIYIYINDIPTKQCLTH